MNNIFATAQQSWTYEQFVQHTEELLQNGKVTGHKQSEDYLMFTRLNLQRMRRWDKTFELQPELLHKLRLLTKQDWWVITEGWCGDSAQNLPAIAKMVAASEAKINLRIVLRDDNPQIMDQYLTNGISRSIPVLVGFAEDGRQLFKWGPRPQPVQALLMAWKNNPEAVPFEEFERELHTWYAKDKGNTLQKELLQLLQ